VILIRYVKSVYNMYIELGDSCIRCKIRLLTSKLYVIYLWFVKENFTLVLLMIIGRKVYT